MKIFKSKLLLILTAIAFILVFFVTISPAEEKMKLEMKGYGVFTKYDQMKPEDMEGHTLTSYEAKGAGTGSFGDVTFINQGTSDLVNGNGTHSGYFKGTDKDGHVYFNKWQGDVTTTKSPEGRPIVKFAGTWSMTGGTGKFEKSQGGGTYKGWFIGPGIYTMISEGDLVINK